MVYNYFPAGYQPAYPNAYQNQMQSQMQAQNQMQNQMQMQNGGYFPVRSEEEARNWYVQPGNILTFFDETKPYCYKKAMGLSPLDRPVFEKYRIVKEDDAETQPEPIKEPKTNQVYTSLADKINGEISMMQKEINSLKNELKRMEEQYESYATKSTAAPATAHADISKNAAESGANLRTNGGAAGNDE